MLLFCLTVLLAEVAIPIVFLRFVAGRLGFHLLAIFDSVTGIMLDFVSKFFDILVT